MFKVVIEILPSNVSDVCENQPFLMLAFPLDDQIIGGEIAAILQQKGFEFETLQLRDFTPKPEKITIKTVFAKIWEHNDGIPAKDLILEFPAADFPLVRRALDLLLNAEAIIRTPRGKYTAGIKELHAFLRYYEQIHTVHVLP